MTERDEERDVLASDRRMTTVFYLAFAAMVAAAVAVLPIVVEAHRLSGLWITLCAAIGFD